MADYEPSLIRDAGEGLAGPKVEHQSANHNYADGVWLLELARVVSQLAKIQCRPPQIAHELNAS
jgi:hypothetical protein